MNNNELWDWLVEQEIATEKELQLVTQLNGLTTKTLEKVLHARTGYKTVKQLYKHLDKS